jgi:hypothetical protein
MKNLPPGVRGRTCPVCHTPKSTYREGSGRLWCIRCLGYVDRPTDGTYSPLQGLAALLGLGTALIQLFAIGIAFAYFGFVGYLAFEMYKSSGVAGVIAALVIGGLFWPVVERALDLGR